MVTALEFANLAAIQLHQITIGTRVDLGSTRSGIHSNGRAPVANARKSTREISAVPFGTFVSMSGVAFAGNPQNNRETSAATPSTILGRHAAAGDVPWGEPAR